MFIKSISIPVADQDRALQFYTETLGFTVEIDTKYSDQPDMAGQRWIELTPPSGSTGIILFSPPGVEKMIGKQLNIIYETDDIQKTYDDLQSKGVSCLTPQVHPWGMCATIEDSEGNSFMIKEQARGILASSIKKVSDTLEKGWEKAPEMIGGTASEGRNKISEMAQSAGRIKESITQKESHVSRNHTQSPRKTSATHKSHAPASHREGSPHRMSASPKEE